MDPVVAVILSVALTAAFVYLFVLPEVRELARNRRIHRAARAAHEANRALQRDFGETVSPSWDEAPEWQRQSAINGVAAVMSGEVQTAEELHERWMQHKFSEGWRYGPVRDAVAKTHPCMLPYDLLTAQQRLKDETFLEVVSDQL